MNTQKECLACKKPLNGRSDKKFCDVHCKSAYNYNLLREDKGSIYAKIDRKLKKNRSILKRYNKAGKATVQVQKLLAEGFEPNFFTHYWKNKKNDVYLFVYEFGFLLKTEKGKKKYILVEWQPYMGNIGI